MDFFHQGGVIHSQDLRRFTERALLLQRVHNDLPLEGLEPTFQRLTIRLQIREWQSAGVQCLEDSPTADAPLELVTPSRSMRFSNSRIFPGQ